MKPPLGSIEALKQGLTTGFVGYPRSYQIGKTPQDCVMLGVDQAGAPFKLTLEVPQRFIDEAKNRADKTVPSLEDLADDDDRAKNPCFATDDNAPGTVSGGAFVAEQVEFIDKDNNVLKATWMSVLKSKTNPKLKKPKICTGYLEINTIFPTADSAYATKKLRLQKLNAIVTKAVADKQVSVNGVPLIQIQVEVSDLTRELLAMGKKHWFIGVDVQYRRIEELDLVNQANARRQIIELLDSNMFDGMYGGVIIRPYREERGTRIVELSCVKNLNTRYNYTNGGGVINGEATWNEFLSKNASWFTYMVRNGMKAEIIPTQRTNCGPVGNANFQKDYLAGKLKQLKSGVDRLFHTYPYMNFEQQSAYLVSPVAMRNADVRKGESKNDTLLSTFHTFGKPLGNVLEIDRDLNRTYVLDEAVKPSGKALVAATAYEPATPAF
ncbi:hypothetical protein HNP46_000136 [Pseudomonas nitritireducens]|uniref:Uncharacterized protein n=1 Tax=Pseudomonas nitroreducens TaxID=46680 RepID=A0A7W7KEE4_PSENT|nr:hypothetical protein [Pseudomonas nitritireducens]MBB4861325.1 hypothetical protein [Pseudomonas nitritireducens]